MMAAEGARGRREQEAKAIIALPDPVRHALSGVVASAAFLALFFGLAIEPALSAPAALIVYIAVFLMTTRRPPSTERMLADDVSEADLRAAVAALEAASERLARAEERAPRSVKEVLAEMSARLRRIAEHHVTDPRDLRHTRRLIRHDLVRMVETCEGFVDLAHRAGGADRERLNGIAERIRTFSPALAKIEQACLDNDFMRLEVETEVLSEQIGR
ncbi:MAG: 5-bromo-4-chloroindolyl phosphate hydrolysis family protein [Neomegalonema sp.]|nr:5-bromo-4-chloroindolyl phosphate hydrolysis family protein [Neomegalonema sp.]